MRLLQSLAEYLETCGGSQSMVDGWYTKTEYRKEGATAGTYDSYFFSPQGKVPKLSPPCNAAAGGLSHHATPSGMRFCG